MRTGERLTTIASVAAALLGLGADGVLTVADFGCFQTRFLAGCP